MNVTRDEYASNGLYGDRMYAMNLARSIAAESNERTKVRQFNSHLWEIIWAERVSS